MSSVVGIIVEIDGRIVLECLPCDRVWKIDYTTYLVLLSKLIPLESSEIDIQAPGEESWEGWISPPEFPVLVRMISIYFKKWKNCNSVRLFNLIKRGYHTRLMVVDIQLGFYL